jgi:hypothetical protein
MRDMVLLTGVFVIIGAGIFFWASHVDPTQISHSLAKRVELRAEEAVAKPQTFPPDPPAPATPKRTSAPARAPKPIAAVVEAPVAVLVAPPAPAAEPKAPPPPFPAVEQIAPGSQQDAITATYGRPTVTTLTSSGGHVIENLIYARNGGHSAAIIHIEDGRVSSAYERAEPAPAAGLSLPRPKSAN